MAKTEGAKKLVFFRRQMFRRHAQGDSLVIRVEDRIDTNVRHRLVVKGKRSCDVTEDRGQDLRPEGVRVDPCVDRAQEVVCFREFAKMMV